jgi:hypothetical protein
MPPEVPTGQPGITAAEPVCKKSGPWEPEGVITGTVGCEYKRDDGVNLEWYYKESEDGSADGGKTGWIMRIKLL